MNDPSSNFISQMAQMQAQAKPQFQAQQPRPMQLNFATGSDPGPLDALAVNLSKGLGTGFQQAFEKSTIEPRLKAIADERMMNSDPKALWDRAQLTRENILALSPEEQQRIYRNPDFQAEAKKFQTIGKVPMLQASDGSLYFGQDEKKTVELEQSKQHLVNLRLDEEHTLQQMEHDDITLQLNKDRFKADLDQQTVTNKHNEESQRLQREGLGIQRAHLNLSAATHAQDQADRVEAAKAKISAPIYKDFNATITKLLPLVKEVNRQKAPYQNRMTFGQQATAATVAGLQRFGDTAYLNPDAKAMAMYGIEQGAISIDSLTPDINKQIDNATGSNWFGLDMTSSSVGLANAKMQVDEMSKIVKGSMQSAMSMIYLGDDGKLYSCLDAYTQAKVQAANSKLEYLEDAAKGLPPTKRRAIHDAQWFINNPVNAKGQPLILPTR